MALGVRSIDFGIRAPGVDKWKWCTHLFLIRVSPNAWCRSSTSLVSREKTSIVRIANFYTAKKRLKFSKKARKMAFCLHFRNPNPNVTPRLYRVIRQVFPVFAVYINRSVPLSSEKGINDKHVIGVSCNRIRTRHA